MKIKVCGMRQPENISAIASLDVDLIGFIFYPRSPRYVNTLLPSTPKHIGRVGVFVDAQEEEIIKTAESNNLTHLQFHGSEQPKLCSELKKRGYKIIKAFQIENIDSFVKCQNYEGAVDLFLFDTASPSFGGSGQSFNWSLLENYPGNLPYILSGGISLYDIENIIQIKDTRLWGVDLNSRFEQSPALKDAILLNLFINKLNKY